MVFLKKITLILIVCTLSNLVFSQTKKTETKTVAPVDTTKKAPAPAKAEPKTGPKAYNEVITSKAKTQKGLMTVHKLDEKWYFEIGDTLLNREIMTVTRFSKTPAGGSIYGGEEENEQVIRWEKAPENKVFLRSITYVTTSPDSTKPMFQAVKNSSVDPIIAVFDIKAIRKDTSFVIDVTDFFKSDNQVISLNPITKQRFKLTGIQADRSYISAIKTFPINTEIRTVKTFGVVPPALLPPSPNPIPQVGQYLPAGRDAGVVSIELNTSMIVLPKIPMRKRLFDSRVGYFANQYTVYEENSQKSDDEVFAVRWRLEPKNNADMEKQKKGELIEPKKPIVFYIDPATPEKWQKYLIDGVSDWQGAFEQAGWKNAIRGEYWPKNDSTMSLEDARFSVIRYFASTIENAYGPNVPDPRTGEILESHIGWYHNLMSLLRNWYMIQTAASDPRARHKKFDDELMGQLIRFVSSHEVGHTLGLRHNMGSSSQTPVEKLRDKNWLAKNGHTASIMDYARFNYVAQPEDGVTDFFPRIGDYDKWAIEWGYKPIYGTKDAKEDKIELNKLVKEKLKNNRLWFGTEVSPFDPRSQTEDLSDNAMKASEYGIKNLKRVLPNLADWTKEEAEYYGDLEETYNFIIDTYRRYMGHVTKNIGGIYDTPKTTDQPGAVYEVVPKTTQKEAIKFLKSQLFDTPTWLLDQSVLSKIRPDQGVEAVKALQETALNNLLDGGRMLRIIETSSQNKANYNLEEFMTDVRTSIFSHLTGKKSLDNYQRNLQKVYVEKMFTYLNSTAAVLNYIPSGVTYGYNSRTVDLKKTDVPSVIRANLEILKTQIKTALPTTADKMTKYHYADILDRIEKALNPNKK